MKFRILAGNHTEGKYPEGHPWAGRAIVYERGEIVDSKSNLARFNSPGPLGAKFQRIYDNAAATNKIGQAAEIAKRQEAEATYDDGNGPHGPLPPVASTHDDLDTMSLADLKKAAKEEGITVTVSSTKESLIEALRGAVV